MEESQASWAGTDTFAKIPEFMGPSLPLGGWEMVGKLASRTDIENTLGGKALIYLSARYHQDEPFP